VTTVEIKLRVPAPSSMLLVNLLGLLGLLGLAVAVGGLTHNPWWSLATASCAAVVVSVIGMTHAEQGAEPAKPRPIAAARTAG